MRHFVASAERILGYTHVILIITGSVASIKAPQIVHELLEVRRLGSFFLKQILFVPVKYENVKIEVVSTQSSLTFFKRGDIESQGVRVWMDEDEWSVGDVSKRR